MAEVKGGQQLDNVLRAIAKKLKGGTVRVGFLEGSTYPDGTSVATVAAIQEFGAPARGIPPRPFFRNMIKQNAASWPGAVKAVLEFTGGDSERAFQIMGDRIAGQLRKSIVATNDPPLSAVTVLLRSRFPGGQYGASDVWQAMHDVATQDHPLASGMASDKPLVWTGHMLASVDYEVQMDNGEQTRGSDRPDGVSDDEWEASQDARRIGMAAKAATF